MVPTMTVLEDQSVLAISVDQRLLGGGVVVSHALRQASRATGSVAADEVFTSGRCRCRSSDSAPVPVANVPVDADWSKLSTQRQN